MLPDFNHFGRVWVEISTDAEHGGAGWEFGRCLWSPVTNEAGARRYQIMEQVEDGHGVIHFRKEPGGSIAISGWTRVAEGCRVVTEAPPEPGVWGGRGEYYRVELENYTVFAAPLSLRLFFDEYGDEVSRELEEDRRRFYPVNRQGGELRTVQGIYLGEATPRLYALIRRALGIEAAAAEAEVEPADLHAEFAEGRRRAAEILAFARNPRLVADAKRRAAGRCELCQLEARQAFGENGAAVLECHHLHPLGEDETERRVTRLEEVLVVCANCHRLFHSRRPAYQPEELRKMLESAASGQATR